MASVSAPSRVSLQNILVATDFSPGSHIALRFAAALARQAKGKLFLAHVIPLEQIYPIPMDAGPGVTGAAGKDSNLLMKQAMSAPELAGIDHAMIDSPGGFCDFVTAPELPWGEFCSASVRFITSFILFTRH